MSRIDNVDFSDLITGYCGTMIFQHLTEISTISDRIKYCKDTITRCEGDIEHFNERKKTSNYSKQCEIETWICEREDKIYVASHYLTYINETSVQEKTI